MVKLSKADNIGYFKTKPKVRISFWNFKFDGNENFHFFFFLFVCGGMFFIFFTWIDFEEVSEVWLRVLFPTR